VTSIGAGDLARTLDRDRSRALPPGDFDLPRRSESTLNILRSVEVQWESGNSGLCNRV
jgi:hypothetical protein